MSRDLPIAAAADQAPTAIALADVKKKEEPKRNYSGISGLCSNPNLQKQYKAQNIKDVSQKTASSLREYTLLKRESMQLRESLQAKELEIQSLKTVNERLRQQIEDNEGTESLLQLSESKNVKLTKLYADLRAGLFKCCFCYCTCDKVIPLGQNPLSANQDALDPDSTSSQHF